MKFILMLILGILLSCSNNQEVKTSGKTDKDKLNNLDINQEKIILKID
tara:strand:- start:543 stop:686 length:144 start_codon:yes stop_codon:yes gene_type:complete